MLMPSNIPLDADIIIWEYTINDFINPSFSFRIWINTVLIRHPNAIIVLAGIWGRSDIFEHWPSPNIMQAHFRFLQKDYPNLDRIVGFDLATYLERLCPTMSIDCEDAFRADPFHPSVLGHATIATFIHKALNSKTRNAVYQDSAGEFIEEYDLKSPMVELLTSYRVYTSISFQVPSLDIMLAKQFFVEQAKGTYALKSRVDKNKCVVIEQNKNITLPLGDKDMHNMENVLLALGIYGECLNPYGAYYDCKAAAVKVSSSEDLIYLHKPRETWVGYGKWNYWPHWFLIQRMKSSSLQLNFLAIENTCLKWVSVWAKDPEQPSLDKRYWKENFLEFKRLKSSLLS